MHAPTRAHSPPFSFAFWRVVDRVLLSIIMHSGVSLDFFQFHLVLFSRELFTRLPRIFRFRAIFSAPFGWLFFFSQSSIFSCISCAFHVIQRYYDYGLSICWITYSMLIWAEMAARYLRLRIHYFALLPPICQHIARMRAFFFLSIGRYRAARWLIIYRCLALAGRSATHVTPHPRDE